MKAQLRSIHRWASLAMAAFWLVQGLTGAFLVFHWELDDWTLAGVDRPTDVAALGAGIQALEAERPGWAVTSVWASAGLPHRYDVTLENAQSGAWETVRVNGTGEPLRRRDGDEMWANGGFYPTIVVLHQKLLAGETGSWIVGISGCLLLSNLAIGLKLAWPAKGSWRRVLLPRRGQSATAALYSWHRALGLLLAMPAFILVACGILLVFEGGVSAMIGARDYEPALTKPVPFNSTPIPPAKAMATALEQYPGATLAGMSMPTSDIPWYRIRVRQPEEIRRVFGTTTLFIDAASGQIIGDYDAFTAPPARRTMDLLFPLHTGEAGGLGGRIFVMLLGLWLVAMIGIGIALWSKHRKR